MSRNIVVIGGGYAGVVAANRVRQREDVAVTVINPRDVFVPRLRLHQLIGGSHDATVEYADVLADGTRLIVDEVDRIDASERTVTLVSGGTVAYDYLVYAVGSGNPGRAVPGVAEFAYRVATLEEARRLRSALFDRPMSAPVTVVGGGPTGIETAAELAEQGRNVTLIAAGALAPYLHYRARRLARRYLAKLGVEVLENIEVVSVTRDSVELGDGRSHRSEITIWNAGFGVPDLAHRSGLRTDDTGRLLTDETLTSVDDERIVAAGDSAAPSDLPFRMSAYTAGCLGAHAADTVLNRIAGKPPTPIDLSFPAMCISFSRGAGIYQLGRKDETALPVFFGGRAGKMLKDIACRISVEHLATEARTPGAHHWFKDGKHRPALLAVARRDTVDA